MIQKLIIRLLIPIFCCTAFYSCELSAPTDFEGINPDVLAPLVISEVSSEDLSELEDYTYSVEVKAADLDYLEGVEVVVPPLNIPFIGPYIFELSEYILSFGADSLDLNFDLINTFPISIDAGTRVVLRRADNVMNDGNIIASHTLTEDLGAGESYAFNLLITDVLVTSKIYLFFEDYVSSGGIGTFSSDPTVLNISADNVSINTIWYRTEREYEIIDTLSFSIGDEIDFDENDVTGELRSFFKNQLPLNFQFQIYLLDSMSNMVIDSLYEERVFIEGALTDPDGNLIEEVNAQYNTELDEMKWESLRSSSDFVFDFKVDTYGYPDDRVASAKENIFEFRLVGDLSLNIKF